MKFVFFGTPSFSTCVLDALEAYGLVPALVVTAPDKPRGRGLQLSPSPVKAWALERGIDVLTPVTLNPTTGSGQEIIAELRNTDWDVFIVAAYAKLLPQAVLDIPRRGCLNVHPSLLPKFRGASPVISAILADEPTQPDGSGHSGGRETGVTIMAMTAEMDAGPIVAQAKVEIAEEDWPPPASVLTDLLFTEGGNLLAETLPLWLAGKIDPVPQDDSKATFTGKFTSNDALIELSPGADEREQFLKIRAFDHNPRAHFFARRDGGQAENSTEKIRVIITQAQWQDNRLVIEKVIPEGRKEMSYREFLTAEPA